jgi:hypothetical protein
LTRKIKFIIVALFTAGLLFLFSSNEAHAEDTVVQIIGDPAPSSDTSTVTSPISVQSIQVKVEEAATTLQAAAQAQSTSIVTTIQANVSNTDTQAAVQIATTQEPIKTAVEAASVKVGDANNAIQAAQTAVQIAVSAQTNVETQTAVVTQAVTTLETKKTELKTTTITNQAAEVALNTQTPITIAAQEANAVARTANDVAQAAVTPANEAVAAQIPVVATAQSVKDTAQATVDVNTSSGLKVEVYNTQGQNNAPVLPANAVPIRTFTDTNGINEQWGNGNVAGSNRSEDVIVKYSGNITFPVG